MNLHDATGNLTGYVYPNSVQTANLFDPLNRLTQTCSATSTPACSASTKLASYAYMLGAAGNRTAVAELGGRGVSYGYDGDYRLASETITADPAGKNGTIGYPSYDAVGNRTQMTSTVSALGTGTTSYSYDANDRLTTDGYDNNGNTTSSGGVSSLYDFENRMTTNGTTTVVYDGDGNRASETVGGATTKYLVDTINPTGLAQVVDETVNGAVTRTYAYGLQRISENTWNPTPGTWNPSFYGYDGHGNVRFLTNMAGTVTDTYQYDAFGRILSISGSTANNFKYSGEWLDPNVGLFYLRARYLNPATGRFWSRDPVEGLLYSGMSWNPYIYVKENAVNRIDPLGQADLIEKVDLDSAVVTFKEHGFAHLVKVGAPETQAEVEAYVEQLVREFIAEAQSSGTILGRPFDIMFAMEQLGNVPWAARVFIVTSAVIEVTTYFPRNVP